MSVDRVIDRLKNITFECDDGHKLDHFMAVYNHGLNAVKETQEEISKEEEDAILIACLLHDVDDSKFFSTTNNENARRIMEECNISESCIELVCEMIDLVSCSKNRSSDCEEKWKLIPRDCDRLESVGVIGMYRAYVYGATKGRGIYSKTSKHPETMEDIKKLIDDNRFNSYSGGSDTLMDHMLDKVLHICRKKYLKSENPYVLRVAKRRKTQLHHIILLLPAIVRLEREKEDHEKLGVFLEKMLL